MQETPIEVGENTDEVIPFTLTTFDAADLEIPLDLDAYDDFEFYIKASRADADGAPVASLSGGGIAVVSADQGQLQVTVARANHASPAEAPDGKWYLLRGITTDGDWKALSFGDYVIKDL